MRKLLTRSVERVEKERGVLNPDPVCILDDQRGVIAVQHDVATRAPRRGCVDGVGARAHYLRVDTAVDNAYERTSVHKHAGHVADDDEILKADLLSAMRLKHRPFLWPPD